MVQQQQYGTCRGGVVSARKQNKTQIFFFLATIQVKEKEMSLVETEFRAVLLCRDGWSHQEAPFCTFTCFRIFAMEEAQCDGVSLIKLIFSPEPLNCLLVFKFQSVPAPLTGSFNEPGGKGLKGVRWRICHGFTAWKLPGNLQIPSCAAQGSLPSGLGTASPSFQTDQRKEKRKLYSMSMSYVLTRDLGMPEMNLQESGNRANGDPTWAPGGPAHCPFQWFWALQRKQLWNCFPQFADCMLPLSVWHWLWCEKAATDSEIKCFVSKELHHTLLTLMLC